MAAYVSAVVRFPADTGIPKDAVQSTFYFATTTSPPPSADLTAITTALRNAYDNVIPELSNRFDYTQADVTFYNLADPTPRVPIETLLLSPLASPGLTKSLPMETALVLSFHGNYISGVNNARRRGRVYVGPFGNTDLDMTTPPAGWVSDLVDMGASLLAASDAAATWTWCIYSRTTQEGGGTLEQSMIPVTSGWVDNAWDTQRRRGIEASSRTLWP